MALKATVYTHKEGLTAPIAFVNLPTLAAFLAGVLGINQLYRDTSKQALVFQELPQLVESPISVSGSLLLANPGPRANAFQVFNGNRSMRVLCKINQPPTDAVIHIPLKPGLSPRKLFEPALGGLCPHRLQDVPAALIPPAFLFYLTGTLDHAVAGDNDVGDTHIDTDHIIYILLWQLFDVTGCIQVELTFGVAEIRLSILGLQQTILVFSASVRDMQTTSHSPYGDKALVCIPGQDALIVGKSPPVGELSFTLLIKLVAIGDLADGSDDHLGREPVVPADVVVGKSMDIVLLENLVIPGHPADSVAGLVGFLQSIKQDILFIWCAEQLDLGGEFHRTIVLQNYFFMLFTTRLKPNGVRLLPRLKAEGVRRLALDITKVGNHERSGCALCAAE